MAALVGDDVGGVSPDDVKNAEEEGRVVVELEEPQEASSDDDDADDVGQKQTRAEKRRARAGAHREALERASRAEAAARAAEERAARIESALGELSRRQFQAPNDNGRDQYQKAIDDVYEQQKAIALRIRVSDNISQSEIDNLERRARELEERKYELYSERNRARQPQPPQLDPVAMGLQVQYSDVYSDRSAMSWAQGWAHQQVAAGRSPDLTLVRESLEQARKWSEQRRGLPPADPPENIRSKFTGPPGRQGSSGEAKPLTMTPSKAQVKMAKALHPKLSESEAIKRWVNTVGRRVMSK